MTELPGIDFETLFSKSPNPYVVMDRDLAIVWMNEAYLGATMSRREDILGRGIFDAFPSDPSSDSHRLLEGSLRKVVETAEADEIALIRYDLRRPDGSMAEMFWSATHTPLTGPDGRTAYILQHTVDVTELHRLRQLREEMSVVQRAGAVQAQNRSLQVESERLRTMFQQAPGFVAVVSGPDHVFQMANAAYTRLVARRDVVGKPIAEALPEVVEQGFVGLLDTVRREGKPYFGHREPVELKKAGSEETEKRCLNFIYQPIFDGDEVSGIFVQGHDVTDEVESAEAQRLLINELNHRVKNTLAIVQGLAAQSFRNLPGADEARRTFDARLNALAAAHSLLTESNWDAAKVADMIESSVEAAVGDAAERFSASGPNVSLPPQTAVSLAMIVHELSTNALKYGAFANDVGEVEVSWAIDRAGDDDELTIDWREMGGPPVAAPSRRGFGSRLIERGLSSGGASEVSMSFLPQGLHCRISTRLKPAQ